LKVLVTGAKGQLGSEICRAAGFEFIAADRDALDITDPQAVSFFLSNVHPDAVIHCAGYTDVDRCETDRDAAFAVNALGARNIAIAADRIGAKLLHISSDYVFGGEELSPRREFDRQNPQNFYGYTKRASEVYVLQHCKRSFIVRTAWLYGLTGGNFVKTVIGAARSGRPLKVVDDQIGNPTNAADLAEHLLRLVRTEEYGVYHCTNNGECSWYDFAREFLRLSDLSCTIEPCGTEDFPRPAKRPGYSALDNMMLRLTIGDKMRPWREAIADYMAHYNKDTGVFGA
jgi:dTDP-4-dehydrorhamnose reductase